MKKSAFIVGAAVVTLALGACHANSPTDLPPGEYSKTTEKRDADGTNVKQTTDTNVYYGNDGEKKAVKTTETTRDPEGLFNKSTTTKTKTY